MEWVETTAKTLEEAKDEALDQLGVDEQDAEFEILEEPSKGLFGRTRGEARVRARVVPLTLRPKQERRRSKSSGSSTKPAGARSQTSRAAAVPASDPVESPAQSPEVAPERSAPKAARSGPKAERPPKSQQRPRRTRDSESAAAEEGKNTMEDSVTVEEQAEIMEEFLVGLLEAFGADGEVTWEKVDEDTVEIEVNGDDLGLLIGPKGATLQSVQDLARTVAQRQASGHHEGRVRVDVGGYRMRRREALARFATQVAEQVRSEGSPKSLEPMNAADRKVVHDTVNEIDGVHTRSDGQDPDRWVVILPDEG